VPVSATDASGEPVKNLTVDDFIIEEEGKPQQIISLGEPGKSPIEIALLFDISSSISAQFPFEQEAAVGFVKSVLKPADSISIFSIGVTPKLLLPRTAVTEAAIRSILTIQPMREPTAFFDSIVDATQYLSKSAEAGSRRVIVVISDGEENHSKRFKLANALSELQRHDCLFYSINPSGQALKLNPMSRKGQDSMEQMSSSTGGKAFVPEKIEDLNANFAQIAAELQAQYLFGYYSSDERADGSFRRITVRASKRPDLRVRARQGYYARKS
jgi:Ca-activated chloride channel family protein